MYQVKFPLQIEKKKRGRKCYGNCLFRFLFIFIFVTSHKIVDSRCWVSGSDLMCIYIWISYVIFKVNSLVPIYVWINYCRYPELSLRLVSCAAAMIFLRSLSIDEKHAYYSSVATGNLFEEESIYLICYCDVTAVWNTWRISIDYCDQVFNYSNECIENCRNDPINPRHTSIIWSIHEYNIG